MPNNKGKLRIGPPNLENVDEDALMFRKVVLPIITVSTEGTITPIGSCFIISCTGKECIALTARHNIEYIQRVDGLRPTSHPTTPREFQVSTRNSQEPANLSMWVAYLADSNEMIPCHLVKAWYFLPGPDLAIALLRIDPEYDHTFKYKVAIDSHGPKEDSELWATGYCRVETSNAVEDKRGVKVEQTVVIPLKRHPCRATAYYDYDEHHLLHYPCFSIDINPEPGMSGGPIYYQRDESVIACGVIAAGSSFEENGLSSLLYPIMLLRVQAAFPFLSSNEPMLLECVEKGMIEDISKAHEHVSTLGRWV